MFTTWQEIVSFLNNRYPFISQDIENLRAKCELSRPSYNHLMLDTLKKEVLLNKQKESD